MLKSTIVLLFLIITNSVSAQSSPHFTAGLALPDTSNYQYGGALGNVTNTTIYSPYLRLNLQDPYEINWSLTAGIGAHYENRSIKLNPERSDYLSQSGYLNNLPEISPELSEFVVIPYVTLGLSFQF